MVLIFKNNAVILSLNKEIYTLDAINTSLADFLEIASIDISSLDNLNVVTLKPKDPELLPVIGYEFMNYLLASIKHSDLVA